MEKMIMVAALILGILAGTSMAFGGNVAFQVIRYQVIGSHSVAASDVKNIMNSKEISPLGNDPNASHTFSYRTRSKNDYRVSTTSQVIPQSGEMVVMLTFTE